MEFSVEAIAEYPSTFEDLNCYHDKMIRSENEYVIIVYSRYFKSVGKPHFCVIACQDITSEVFRSGRVFVNRSPYRIEPPF
jgi:hypothetical protein